jgi:phage/plasmid-like protein (TIGR03299 family)
MAHEIENMLYVGAKPWHGLGKAFPEAPSLEEAIVAAGLDWKVGLKKLQTTDTQETVDALATFRESDNRILGVVGPNYHPLQNRDAFEFFRPFIDSKEASIETAGSLKSGQRVFILAKINRDPMVIKGNDIVDKYVLLSNSHDGTLAVRVGFTPVRVVCSNTLTMAHGDKASKLLRVKHTSGVVANLDAIRDVMNIANSEFEATADQYRNLAGRQISSKDLEKYVKLVFSQKAIETNAGGIDAVKSKVLADIVPLFEGGRGNDMAEIKGTYWAAYNAINEYLQYNRGETVEGRFDQLWFGSAAQLNKRALDVGLILAAA